ncbi:hypothetical protein J7I98_05365 [Streptomyces sp. ISL-98]|uniref:hypothetical protein n=1 Tax=Streptomyces sp. ISL-98 TaxID=2819192 RepID=UPI001BE7B69E|nr:hypothetical protein [Streptomyces sp. ISL-98]MBT2505336.1 hypothetical protein [Streptomyces sp. ISL-98]
MSSATFAPGPSVHRTRPLGATALGAGHPVHVIGSALRAVRVFTGAAFSVAVLGEYREYGEEAGVKLR